MIEINRDLKDIVISALRYSIGRRSMITYTTCDFIMANSRLIDERVKDIMLRDLENIEDYYDKDSCDYIKFVELREFLKNLD